MGPRGHTNDDSPNPPAPIHILKCGPVRIPLRPFRTSGQPDSFTHTVMWLPAYLADQLDCWQLFGAGHADTRTYGMPRDVDEPTMKRWVESQMGHPVTLTKGSARIHSLLVRRISTPRDEPIFFVNPMGGDQS